MTAGMQRSADALSRLAMSHDASRFLLTPEEVVVASGIADVQALFAEATHHRRHLTLRGGGTSLSGQSITDGILVDVRRRFRDIEVLDDGARVRAGAGATVAQVNARLKPYGRRIGADPASARAATMGGVVANNSSGKLCGQADDPFHTIDALVAVLPNGRVVDTADPDADISLTWEDPTLAGGLAILRRRLRDDPESMAEIARLWSMRNAMGYHLQALTDFAKPSSILRQLLVGSEGTLAFIAEVTMRTVPLRPAHRVDLALFDTLDAALDAAAGLVEHGFDAIELFDDDAIRLIQGLRGVAPALRGIEVDGHAALSLELHADTPELLAERVERARDVLDELPDVREVTGLVRDEPLWHVHHGTHTAEAIRRPPGTSLVIEDFSVPREHVGDVIRGLNALFDRHGMARPAITGHLTDCTLHFMLTEKFSDQKRLRNYKRFAEGFVRLVLRKGGVLKAQYGTGRAMAPFLERQVGVELYECMREIKHLFDPLGILNPGVIFGDVPDTHLANLKLMPTISDSVDRCIECGLCETACPSSELTLSARQRIVLQREIAARRDDKELLAAVSENFQYAAIDTCSTASMCQLACPLGVDTGELVRRQRSARTTEKDERNWDRAARNWSRTTQLGAAAMSTAKRIKPLARSLLRFGRERLGGDQVWMYTEDLPGGSSLRRRPRKERTARDPVAAYFPGCQQTFLGASGQGVYGAFNELCTKAGVAVSLLNASELCCGLPWSTRGMTLGQQTMQSKVRRVLAPRAGETVVVDSSSCTHALRETLAPYGEPMPRIVDVVDFVADEILPRLTITRKLGSLLLYPSCGNAHLDNWPALLRITDAIAEETVVPATWTCCGAHGDQGLLHPELPRSATRLTVDEIRARHFDAHASTTRTCEVALSRLSGRRFVHLLEVLALVHREG